MSKTLAIILNYNLPELTDNLYESLEPYNRDLRDIFVMDNGSKPNLKSKYTYFHLDKNIFWGGALNFAFDYMLKHAKYDSLLFLNNDIEVNGENLIKSLRRELFKTDLAIISPCIAGKANPWKQMQCWGSNKIRVVDWIDMQAPLFHRKIIEEIRQFDEKLILGWGQELVCQLACNKNHWNTGVCDFISIIHFAKQTFETKVLHNNDVNSTKFQGASVVDHNSYGEMATKFMHEYFMEKGYNCDELHEYGRSYNMNSIRTIKGNIQN